MNKYRADAPLPPVDYQGGTWFLGAARAYSHIGFALVPNKPGTKAVAKDVLRQRPEGDRSEWWSYVAITDPAEVERIWTAYPFHCPGLVTGRISRTLVIDLDVKNGEDPHQELQDWQYSTGIKLPAGPKVTTPTGGEHWYYRLPEDCPPIPSVSGWLPGVDIRADKGQLILPPSFNLAAEDKQEAEYGYVVDSQYHWMDLGGAPYNPTPEEIQAELDDATAPQGLIDDVLEFGASRTATKRLEAIREASKGASVDLTGIVRTEDGEIDVSYYEANGIPVGIQENVLFMLATIWGGKAAITEDEAVHRGWEIIKKSPQRSGDEWRRSQVEHKVRKQHRWAKSDTAARKAKEDAETAQRMEILRNLFPNTYKAK